MEQVMIAAFAAAVNLVAFFAMALDKYFSVKGHWRISERALLFWALAGGSAGSLAGMVVCRHKINKNRFRYGVPVMLLIQMIALVGVAWSRYLV